MIKMLQLSGLFALLLFICFVHSCTGDAGSKTVAVFKAAETKVLYKDKSGEILERTPSIFRVPAFVGGMVNNKEFLAIICGAHFYRSSHRSLIEGAVSTSYENHNIWTTAEIFTNDTQTGATHTLGGDFTAVMKDNKIYVLTTRYDKNDISSTRGRFGQGWDPLMFVGTIKYSASSAVSGASITWEEGKSLKDTLSPDLSKLKATQFIGGVGNGAVTKSGAIVFPIYMVQQNSERSSSLLYSTDNGSKWQIGGKTEEQTYHGSVVEWGDDKLLYIVSSDKGYRRVFESDNMGSTWNESFVFSGVWGDEPSRQHCGTQGSAIKTSVDEKDVLLFAHPLTENGGSSADTLQLWLSDGQRIVRIGTISEEDKEDHTGNAILAYVGDHLYITHEINPNSVWGASENVKEWEKVIGFSHLTQFLKSAKTTVRAWRELDRNYNTKGIPTDGLVGFLENTKRDNSVWTDMYNCVHATVSGGKSVIGGFQFDGEPGSGAQWPVASQGQNQVYIFAEKQFTLAATVIIHAEKDNGECSLIGVSLDSSGNNVLFGLGYTHDNKWFAVGNDKKKIKTEKVFVRNKVYHVALTFASGAASVFVDGEEIANKKLETKQTSPISHFFMGGMGHSSTAKGSLCTVKNVMLFNRNLEENKIVKLSDLSKNINLEEPMPTEEPTALRVNQKSKETKEPMTLPKNQKSAKKKEPMDLLVKQKILSTSHPEETSITDKPIVSNGSEKGKTVDNVLRDYRNASFQNDMNGADSSFLLFGFVQFLCFACSIVLLA